jgi:hypothetical protein
MNPYKETGLDNGFGNICSPTAGKSDGWHADVEDILAVYEAASEGKSSCEKPC